MRTIAVMNQKGGVGKTTSSVNIAAALAREGRRVCLLDLDPQGHASFHVGVEAGPDMPTVYDVFTQQVMLDETRQLVGENLSLIPANIDLAATEVELAGVSGREFFLRNAMQHWKEQNRFDYVVMDLYPAAAALFCAPGTLQTFRNNSSGHTPPESRTARHRHSDVLVRIGDSLGCRRHRRPAAISQQQRR